MRVYRCKCGKQKGYSSDGPFRDCHGCTECRTTLAERPDLHQPLVEHEFETVTETCNLGVEHEVTRCRLCRNAPCAGRHS